VSQYVVVAPSDDNEEQLDANDGWFVLFIWTVIFSAARIIIYVNKNYGISDYRR
jgi:hypothetical protein